MTRSLRIALAGQPNAGKSTMFNALTGSAVRVGNYPGITVERIEGVHRRDGVDIRLIDLPGTYSLTSYSPEEKVARDVILGERPDAVICMVDATCLERSLYLAVQLLEMGAPLVIGLNMMDEITAKGIEIDVGKLSTLLGAPVVACVARRGTGKDALLSEAIRAVDEAGGIWQPARFSYGPDLDPVLEAMTARMAAVDFLGGRYPLRWLALKYAERDDDLLRMARDSGGIDRELEAMAGAVEAHLAKTLNTYPEAVVADYRYGCIASVVKQCVVIKSDQFRRDFSDAVDRVLTHQFLGPITMMVVLYGMFYFTFTLGSVPQEWMLSAFAWLGRLVSAALPDGLLESLIVSGIIDGVGGVLSFTPLITIMFLMLVFLEDLGYMARVAYMLDKVFRMFGLHGASVMPFIISGGLPGGCAVPGIMATRTLKSPNERLATILTAPFLVCGAKVTAFLVLTAAFFPEQGSRVMFALTILSWFFVLLVARLLRWTIIPGPSTPFVMELPPYRMPTLYGVVLHTFDRVWQYVKKAGTLILAVSIVMWALMTFPAPPEHHAGAVSDDAAPVEARAPEDSRVKTAIEYSFAGRVGTAIEPVTRLAGLSWRTNVALIGAFAAKEIFVSTMATAYALSEEESDEQHQTLVHRLAADPAMTPPAIWALFVFLLLYSPCMATSVVIAREAGWRWAVFGILGSIALSFTFSVGIYQAGTLLGY